MIVSLSTWANRDNFVHADKAELSGNLFLTNSAYVKKTLINMNGLMAVTD